MIEHKNTETSTERDKKLKAQAIEAFQEHVLHKEDDRRWMIARHYEDGSFCNNFWAEIVVLADNSLLVHGDIDSCIFSRCSYNDPRRVLEWVGKHSSISYYLRQKANIGLNTSGQFSPLDAFDTKVARWEIEGKIKKYPSETDHYGNWLEEIDESEDESLCVIPWLEILLTEGTLLGSSLLPTNENTTIDQFLQEKYNLTAKKLQTYYNDKLKKLRATDALYAIWCESAEKVGNYSEDYWGYVQFIDCLYEELVDAGEQDVGEAIGSLGLVPDSRLYYCWAAARRLVELLEEKDAKEDVEGTSL